MPAFVVRVEVAVALDLDLQVEASDEAAAFELADEAASGAAPLRTLTQRFSAFQPTFIGGHVTVSDIAVRSVAPER